MTRDFPIQVTQVVLDRIIKVTILMAKDKRLSDILVTELIETAFTLSLGTLLINAWYGFF